MDATYHIPPQQYAAIQQGLPPLPSSHNPPHDPNYRPLPPPPPQHYHNPPPSANPQYQYPPPSTHQASREHSQALGVKEEMDSSIGAIGPPPLPYSAEVAHEGRKYTLEVCQQPMRARMCGFGDKDRRPITPPPCVRLVITDLKDGKVIDTNDIDHGFYVLNVDLWSPDGTKEWNLVRHANSSPVPPPSSTYSGAGSAEPNTPVYANSPMGAGPRESYSQYSYGQPTNGNASQPPAPYSAYPPQSGYPPQHPQAQYGQNQAAYPPRPSSPGYGRGYPDGRDGYPAAYGAPRDGWQPENQRTVVSQQQQPAGGMYTRNLIGSLAASAFRLTDTNDRIGIWFVLQDLSVRTEGTFRLRFSFVNVGVPEPAVNGNGSSGAIVNTGRAPILASCFSDPFTVYSAKKFPGVVESTPLSKMFAGQGIKIPIRKDGENSKKNDDD